MTVNSAIRKFRKCYYSTSCTRAIALLLKYDFCCILRFSALKILFHLTLVGIQKPDPERPNRYFWSTCAYCTIPIRRTIYMTGSVFGVAQLLFRYTDFNITQLSQCIE